MRVREGDEKAGGPIGRREQGPTNNRIVKGKEKDSGRINASRNKRDRSKGRSAGKTTSRKKPKQKDEDEEEESTRGVKYPDRENETGQQKKRKEVRAQQSQQKSKKTRKTAVANIQGRGS